MMSYQVSQIEFDYVLSVKCSSVRYSISMHVIASSLLAIALTENAHPNVGRAQLLMVCDDCHNSSINELVV